MSKPIKLILAVAAENIFAPMLEHGFYPADGSPIKPTEDLQNFWFGPRPSLEEDPTYKQIIPYVVVRDEEGNILTYSRTKKGNEARLHDKRSIGFGGHIDLEDVLKLSKTSLDYMSIARVGMFRELYEELGGPAGTYADCTLIGTVNDTDPGAGEVHFGLVHEVIVSDPSVVAAQETAITDLRWEPVSSVAADIHVYEEWSSSIIGHYFRMEG